MVNVVGGSCYFSWNSEFSVASYQPDYVFYQLFKSSWLLPSQGCNVNNFEAYITLCMYSMYWVEMILNVVLVICCLQILIRVDFISLTPEEIEKIEIEELKHRMEIT